MRVFILVISVFFITQSVVQKPCFAKINKIDRGVQIRKIKAVRNNELKIFLNNFFRDLLDPKLSGFNTEDIEATNTYLINTFIIKKIKIKKNDVTVFAVINFVGKEYFDKKKNDIKLKLWKKPRSIKTFFGFERKKGKFIFTKKPKLFPIKVKQKLT